MDDLHTALQTLSAIPHSSFPSSPSSLQEHIRTLQPAAHTLLSSLPRDDPKHSDWKPVKIPAKDNPASISVYKLSAADSNGTWFARVSTHPDIPFARFRSALQRELHQPGEPVRGIGREETLAEVRTELAAAETLVLAAQFPGPSAPRVFVEMCVRWEEEAAEGGVYTVVSRPVEEAPGAEREGHVMGTYESIESVREVQGGVEWVMITRSDPGGNVPRFMVERGTPGGIVKDAEKFLRWCETVEVGDEAAAEEPAAGAEPAATENAAAEQPAAPAQPQPERPVVDAGTVTDPPPTGAFTNALTTVTTQLASLFSTDSSPSHASDSSSDSDTVSTVSTTTALSHFDTPGEFPLSPPPTTTATADDTTTSPPATAPKHTDRALHNYLKEKLKLEQRRQKAEAKHARAMEKHERKYRRALEKAKRRGDGGRRASGAAEERMRELQGVVQALTRENLMLRERVEELEGKVRAAERCVGEAAGVGGE